MLQLTVKKRLGPTAAARELTVAFRVAAGEVVALSGPSGVGKTTLLRLLAGLDRPDAGRIQFADQCWFDHDHNVMLPTERRRIGFVFQDYALFPHMTVREQLRYGQRDAQQASATDEIDRWFQVMDLTAEADRLPSQLSGGQRQRLALARAMIGRPHLLLLDEPLSALDASLRHEIQQRLLLALREQPTTTLLVSHDPAEIIRMAQRVVILSPDAPMQIGTPAELLLGNLTPGRCLLHATVLALLPADVMTTVVLSIGHDRITTLVTHAEAARLQAGQTLQVEMNGTSAVLRH